MNTNEPNKGAGKGDKPRSVDKKVYDKNFQEINWQKNRKMQKLQRKNANKIRYLPELRSPF